MADLFSLILVEGGLSGLVLGEQEALLFAYSINQSRNTTGVPELDSD